MMENSILKKTIKIETRIKGFCTISSELVVKGCNPEAVKDRMVSEHSAMLYPRSTGFRVSHYGY